MESVWMDTRSSDSVVPSDAETKKIMKIGYVQPDMTSFRQWEHSIGGKIWKEQQGREPTAFDVVVWSQKETYPNKTILTFAKELNFPVSIIQKMVEEGILFPVVHIKGMLELNNWKEGIRYSFCLYITKEEEKRFISSYNCIQEYVARLEEGKRHRANMIERLFQYVGEDILRLAHIEYEKIYDEKGLHRARVELVSKIKNALYGELEMTRSHSDDTEKALAAANEQLVEVVNQGGQGKQEGTVNAALWEDSCRAACSILVEIMSNGEADIIKRDFEERLKNATAGKRTHSKVDRIAWEALPDKYKHGPGCPKK